MVDIDIDPFGEHESRTEEPTDESIPLTPVGRGGSNWDPTHEQETSFRGRESQRNRVLINWVEGLYSKLSQKLPRTSEVFHYGLFELRNSKLYLRDKSTPLTLFDMGGPRWPPKMFLPTVPKRLGGGS